MVQRRRNGAHHMWASGGAVLALAAAVIVVSGRGHAAAGLLSMNSWSWMDKPMTVDPASAATQAASLASVAKQGFLAEKHKLAQLQMVQAEKVSGALEEGEVPPQSLHWPLTRLCTQMEAPPHSLHLLLTRLCSQMEVPPQPLHLLLTRLCSQMCQRRTSGSRSRDIGYGFVDLERPGFEQSSNGLGPTPVASAYGPSTEGAGTRVCGYAIKNSGLTVV